MKYSQAGDVLGALFPECCRRSKLGTAQIKAGGRESHRPRPAHPRPRRKSAAAQKKKKTGSLAAVENEKFTIICRRFLSGEGPVRAPHLFKRRAAFNPPPTRFDPNVGPPPRPCQLWIDGVAFQARPYGRAENEHVNRQESLCSRGGNYGDEQAGPEKRRTGSRGPSGFALRLQYGGERFNPSYRLRLFFPSGWFNLSIDLIHGSVFNIYFPLNFFSEGAIQTQIKWKSLDKCTYGQGVCIRTSLCRNKSCWNIAWIAARVFALLRRPLTVWRGDVIGGSAQRSVVPPCHGGGRRHGSIATRPLADFTQKTKWNRRFFFFFFLNLADESSAAWLRVGWCGVSMETAPR